MTRWDIDVIDKHTGRFVHFSIGADFFIVVCLHTLEVFNNSEHGKHEITQQHIFKILLFEVSNMF